ncbi:Uncharacterised protein [uncultured Eubacterium sp.]|nr:Uncharacterised protein [uncultured Eubacterium sp.]
MSRISDQEIRQYCRQVRRLLPVHTQEEKQFIHTLQSDMEAFVKENPEISLEDLTDQFHSPKQVASDYLASLNHTRLCSLLSLRSHVKKTISLLLILAILAGGCYLALLQVADYIFDNEPTIRIWRTEPAEEVDHE